jgi:hypothetical protein
MKRSNMKKPAAPKPITLSVMVVDIVYKHRVVEFPSVCPNKECGADLTQPGAMWGAEYSCMTRDMSIEGDNEVTFDEMASSEFGGDGDIGWTQVACKKCNTVLADGEERDETEKPAPATEPIPEPIQSRMGF